MRESRYGRPGFLSLVFRKHIAISLAAYADSLVNPTPKLDRADTRLQLALI